MSEFRENMKNLTALKLVAMATVIAWISREPFDRIDLFFHQLSSFVESFKP